MFLKDFYNSGDKQKNLRFLIYRYNETFLTDLGEKMVHFEYLGENILGEMLVSCCESANGGYVLRQKN